MSTSRFATRCFTSPSFCHTPYTPSKEAPSASFLNFSTKDGQTITLIWPVSSSSVMNSILFAMPGH